MLVCRLVVCARIVLLHLNNLKVEAVIRCNPNLTEALVAIELREDIQRLLPDVESLGEEFAECFFSLLNKNPEMEATSLLTLAVDEYERLLSDESNVTVEVASSNVPEKPKYASSESVVNDQVESHHLRQPVAKASTRENKPSSELGVQEKNANSLVSPLAVPNLFVRFLPSILAIPLAVLGLLYALFVPETLYYALGIMLGLWIPVLEGWFGYVVFFLLLMVPILNVGIMVLLVVQSFIVTGKFIFGTYDPSIHGFITMYPAVVGSIVLLTSLFSKR